MSQMTQNNRPFHPPAVAMTPELGAQLNLTQKTIANPRPFDEARQRDLLVDLSSLSQHKASVPDVWIQAEPQ